MNSKERFASKVKVRESGCHEWVGCRLPWGYGKVMRDKKTWLAHRYAWFLEHGEEPDALILHRCDNPPCVNPAHLFVGTAGDNTRDMRTKGRHTNHMPFCQKCKMTWKYSTGAKTCLKCGASKPKGNQYAADPYGLKREPR